jgi:hypothetical protein
MNLHQWIQVYFEQKGKEDLLTNLTPKKAAFIAILRNKGGNVTEACKATGVNRRMYYDWREKDPEFMAATWEIQESILDFTESMLLKNIQNGSEASIFFKLKCQGKSRGYVERQEIRIDANVRSTHFNMNIDLNKLTREEKEHLREILRKATPNEDTCPPGEGKDRPQIPANA